jgi:hypothetical protein
MNEERAVRAYGEIMQCTERDARCVFMYLSAVDDGPVESKEAALIGDSSRRLPRLEPVR